MALELIGAGFGRTGTLSVKAALDRLGFGPCHHMKEVFASAAERARWARIARGESIDWDEVFQRYRATIDWPSTNYWRELAAHYPNARVLVTTRPVEDWIRSMQATICRLIPNRHRLDNIALRDALDTADRLIAEQTFNGRLDDPATLRSVYEQRLRDVREHLPEERVLFYSVTDGWEPLCAFLGVSVPDEPFPSSNQQDEFWQNFGGGRPL